MKAKLILSVWCCLLVCTGADGQTPNPQTQQLKERIACNYNSPAGLLSCAESYGPVSSYTVTTGAAANAALNESAYDQSWKPSASVLVITYSSPVVLWRVAGSLSQLENGSWLMQANPIKRELTKQETINLYALPDCVSIPPCLQESQPAPTCPRICQKLPPAQVIRWVGQVRIPPGTPMSFGVAGPNLWGQGGQLQWQVLNGFPIKEDILNAERWLGDK